MTGLRVATAVAMLGMLAAGAAILTAVPWRLTAGAIRARRFAYLAAVWLVPLVGLVALAGIPSYRLEPDGTLTRYRWFRTAPVSRAGIIRAELLREPHYRYGASGTERFPEYRVRFVTDRGIVSVDRVATEAWDTFRWVARREHPSIEFAELDGRTFEQRKMSEVLAGAWIWVAGLILIAVVSSIGRPVVVRPPFMARLEGIQRICGWSFLGACCVAPFIMSLASTGPVAQALGRAGPVLYGTAALATGLSGIGWIGMRYLLGIHRVVNSIGADREETRLRLNAYRVRGAFIEWSEPGSPDVMRRFRLRAAGRDRASRGEPLMVVTSRGWLGCDILRGADWEAPGGGPLTPQSS